MVGRRRKFFRLEGLKGLFERIEIGICSQKKTNHFIYMNRN